ncbi:MAG: ADP-ribosylglycohydrolase family protein [Lachnospiraceae bacterium]|nr:ADP-ribosylglycohydrolase family protein [Lachnospiraceae bacterium]
MIPNQYIEKTYAGWLGKAVGIRMGAPIENWSKEKIELIYGKKMKDYPVAYHDFASDDDSNGPLYFVRALKDYKKVTAREMGYTCLNYIPYEHGFFWWGEELSTEHTAYKNLLAGMEAPQTGSAQVNGTEIATQIGGQIFIDCFGFVAPGNPKLAAQLAENSARVTHDLDGVEGARFIAACISLAYIKTDILTIISEALGFIDKECDYYRVVTDMIRIREEGKSYEEAYDYLKEHYWTDRYRGVCHIIPNAGIIAIALLHGEGRFDRTMEIVNLCGFDTDCNAGNVGSIMGVLCGIESDSNEKGIPKHLIAPIQDVMLASGIIGSLNISTISDNALLFAQIGYDLAGEQMPQPYASYVEAMEDKNQSISHFEFPEAIHGFRVKGHYKNAEVAISNTDADASNGKRCLKVTINNLHSKNQVSIYQKTYYTPNDLHDARYQPSFSPVVYPGDGLSCLLKNVTGQKIKFSLYYKNSYDSSIGIVCEKDSEPGAFIKLEGCIPYLVNGLIKEVGVIVESREETDLYFGEQVVIYLDDFIVKGNPDYSMEFNRLKIEDYTLHGTVQQELEGFTHYYKNLLKTELSCDGLVLKDGERIYTGHYYWRDYCLTCEFEQLEGDYMDILVRNQGILRSYAVRLSKDQIAIIRMHEKKEEVVTEAEFSVRKNERYVVHIEVKENLIKAECNGICLSVKDHKEDAYLHGGIGFGAGEDAKTHLISYRVH